VVVLLGITGLARAQPPSPELTREFGAGVDAFRLGNYAEARVHLEKAKALAPKLAGPNRFLAAVAQAELKWDECIAAARAALAQNPQSEELADTRKLHDECRSSAGRPPYRGDLGESAAIAVTTNVPASVRIRGLTYGGTPMAPRPITAGHLALDIEKVGYRTARVDVDALPGIVTDVIVELEQGESTLTQVTVRPSSGRLVVSPPQHRGPRQIEIDGLPVTLDGDRLELSPGVHVVEVRTAGADPWRRRVAIGADGTTTITPDLPPSGPRARNRTIGMILVGGGAAVVAVGIGAFYASRGAADEAREIARQEIARPPGDLSTPVRTRAEFDDARSRWRTWSVVSNLAWGTGLVMASGGIYLAYRFRPPSLDEPAFAIAPVSGGAIVTRSVRW